MPRHSYKRIPVNGDPIYDSYEVSKLINYIMRDGKKSVAEKIVYDLFEEYSKSKEDPLKILYNVINNVGPNVEVRPRRLGGASYLVPTEVRKERKLYLALNWVIDAAGARSNKEYKTFKDKLKAEMDDVLQNQGAAVAKRQQAEKLAEANKAFAHLKW
jgi:small subunit ribosomal protein S7